MFPIINFRTLNLIPNRRGNRKHRHQRLAKLSSLQQAVMPGLLTTLAILFTAAGTADVSAAQPDNLQSVQAEIERILPTIDRCVVVVEGGVGVIVSKDGLVLTAAHIAREVGRQLKVDLVDGRSVTATVLGSDANLDLGVLRLNSRETWPYLPNTDSDAVTPGQWCLDLGFPIGFNRRGRPNLRLGRVLQTTPNLITTDCTISGGDSGGPLVNLAGELIAINSRVNSRIDQNYHLPVNLFHAHWTQLIAGESNAEAIDDGAGNRAMPMQSESNGSETRPLLGIQAQNDRGRVRVVAIVPNSPADQAAIQANDVILAFDGVPVKQFSDILQSLDARKPRETVSLRVNRFGKLIDQQVTLGEPTPITQAAEPTTESSIHSRFAPAVANAIHAAISKTETADVARAQGDQRSIVVLVSDQANRSLGTVVASGLVVAKLSELGRSFRCYLNDQPLAAKMVAIDRRLDLALMQVDSPLLAPIALPLSVKSVESGNQLRPPVQRGQMVVSQGAKPGDVRLGIVSTRKPTTLTQPTREEVIDLGISTNDWPVRKRYQIGSQIFSFSGLEVTSVIPQRLGEACGILAGDLIQSFNGTTIGSRKQLLDLSKELNVRDSVSLTVARAGELKTLTATIEYQLVPLPSDHWGGGPFNNRRFELGDLICHDTPIPLEEIGGPLLALDGRVIGLNIARSMRVATFATPIESVYQFVIKHRPGAVWRFQDEAEELTKE